MDIALVTEDVAKSHAKAISEVALEIASASPKSRGCLFHIYDPQKGILIELFSLNSA
jgi:hypothetical protein